VDDDVLHVTSGVPSRRADKVVVPVRTRTTWDDAGTDAGNQGALM
jgi:hypothetical protein